MTARVVAPAAFPGFTLVWAETARSFARHTHDQFGIGLMDRGAHRSASGRGLVEAVPRDLITVNPNEVHDGFPVDGQPRAWRMIYFEPSVIVAAARDIHQGQALTPELAYPVLTRPLATAAFEALHAVVAASSPFAQAHGEERLLGLVAELLDVAPSAPIMPPDAIARARRRIDADPADAAPLSTLAQEAGLSPFVLVRAFTRHVGLPPHAYRVQKRIHLARRLLLTGHAPAEVAIECGFADQSHLTRALTRFYGITPGLLVHAAN
jgi:AraC-like DNA-binding protein